MPAVIELNDVGDVDQSSEFACEVVPGHEEFASGGISGDFDVFEPDVAGRDECDIILERVRDRRSDDESHADLSKRGCLGREIVEPWTRQTDAVGFARSARGNVIDEQVVHGLTTASLRMDGMNRESAHAMASELRMICSGS